MASAEARVHKLSAEAFSRLKNDHEQFLEAYESEWCLLYALRGSGFRYFAWHCMGCVPVCSGACAFFAHPYGDPWDAFLVRALGR